MTFSKDKDPMGKAIYDFAKNNKPSEIIVYSPEFFDDVIETAYLFRGYEDFPEVEQLAMKESKGAILDVGCGAGSHALYLKEQNKDVEGIDISEYICELMESKGVKTYCEDIFEFNSVKKYNTILLLMNGLGIAGTRAQLPQFLSKLKSLLEPGGQILIESCSTDYLFDNEKDAEEFSGEIEYQMEYDGIKGDPFYWLYLPYKSLEKDAKESGFLCENLLEYEGSTYLAKLTVE